MLLGVDCTYTTSSGVARPAVQPRRGCPTCLDPLRQCAFQLLGPPATVCGSGNALPLDGTTADPVHPDATKVTEPISYPAAATFPMNCVV
jgi:hypothetical protein